MMDFIGGGNMISANKARKRSLKNLEEYQLLTLRKDIKEAIKYGQGFVIFITDYLEPTTLNKVSKKLYKKGYVIEPQQERIGDEIVNEWKIIW